MSEKLRGITEFVWKGLETGKKGIVSIGHAATKTAAQTGILKMEVSGLGRGLSKLWGTAKRAGLVLGGLAGASIYLGKGFMDLAASQGAVSRGFETLAGKAGFSAARALEIMQEKTRGTVHALDLMKQANSAFLLKIPLSEERLGMLSEAAFKLGKVMGQDALYGMESLVTGIGRQSRMMLDNLGIIVKADSAYERYAKQLGKSKDKLTEQERKLAFVEAAFAGVEERLKAVGMVEDDASDRLAKMGNRWTDLKIKIGEALASSPAVEDFMNGISRGFETAIEWVEKNRDTIDQWVRVAMDGFGKVADAARSMFEVLDYAIIGSTEAAAKAQTGRATGAARAQTRQAVPFGGITEEKVATSADIQELARAFTFLGMQRSSLAGEYEVGSQIRGMGHIADFATFGSVERGPELSRELNVNIQKIRDEYRAMQDLIVSRLSELGTSMSEVREKAQTELNSADFKRER